MAPHAVDLSDPHFDIGDSYLPPTEHLVSYGGFLSESTTGSAYDIAIDYLRDNAGELGLTVNDLNHFVVTDQYVSSHTGTTHIYLGQTFNGLEVVNADININITDDGRVLNVGSSFVPGLDHPTTPTAPAPFLNARIALNNFATELGSSTNSQIVSAPQGTEQTTVLEAGGFSNAPVSASLKYVPVSEGGVELAWSMSVVPEAGGVHWYDTHVSAVDGDVLFTSDRILRAAYNVVPAGQDSIDEGGRSVVVDVADQVASPFGWHNINGGPGNDFTDTRGNNTFTQSARNTSANDIALFTFLGLGDSIAVGPRPDGGENLVFDFPLDLSDEPSEYEDAATTNLFYMINVLHDVHYQYGFDEESGNFQFNNFGRGGEGSDELMAFAQVGADLTPGDFNNAFFVAAPDGQNPAITMFEFDTDFSDFNPPTLGSPLPINRDGDLDNGVIVHEYGHGVSTRLVGGAGDIGSLANNQGGGMGEGWSDWWALMFGMDAVDQSETPIYVGTHIQQQDRDEGPGFRNFAYSTDMSVNPLTYNWYNLPSWPQSENPGPFGQAPGSEVHNAGEIWAATLWDLNWLLVNGDGDRVAAKGFEPDLYNASSSAGNTLALQLVMDGLKLTPSNPTMLDGRDAILAADMDLTGGDNQFAIWKAFAGRGMGFSARGENNIPGTGLVDIVSEAFDLPPELVLPSGIIRASGTVFEDANADGVLNFGEGGAGGRTVFLDSNNNGQLNIGERSTETSADGTYSFGFVEPGTAVRVVVPDGFFQTLPAANQANTVVGNDGEFVTGLDFGVAVITPGSVTGMKWNDLDGNGVKGASEPGLAGVHIYADLNLDGFHNVGEPSVSTSADGTYVLDDLAPGDYVIREVSGAGFVQIFPNPAVFDGHNVTILPSQTVANINFGNRALRDYGDLPDDYGTLAGSGGPSHGVSTGFRLGPSIDGEGDGVPSGDALGDGTDEDGVSFTTGLEFGAMESISVNASTSNGFLHGWLDANGDGDFDDLGEKVIDGVPLTMGDNSLAFLVPDPPDGVEPGETTYMRFRFGVEPELGPNGPALFGEVEDYAVTIPMAADTGLVANDDPFSVPEDSSDNPLDVLANDQPGPAGGTLEIIDVSMPNQNGTVMIVGGGTSLEYTPAADFQGTETFIYTVTDGIGGTRMATVSVDVQNINDPPDAVDDNLEVGVNSTGNVLNLLANDTFLPDPPETLTIINVGMPDQNGSVMITGGGSNVTYTPMAGFTGTETFTYEISDGNGGMDMATVTVQVQPPTPQVNFRLETTDLSRNPISTADVGDDFLLRAYVQDVRSMPVGVFAAYLDATFDAGLVTPSGSFVYGPDYPNGQSGNTTTPGLLDEVGAFDDGQGPISGDEFFLWEIRLTADAVGMATFASDPADIVPLHDVTLADDTTMPVPEANIVFGMTTLDIREFAANDDMFEVETNSEDNPFDVLMNDTLGSAGGVLQITDVDDFSDGGMATIVSGTSLSYTPMNGFNGTETFTYTITNGLGDFDTATVTVGVGSVNNDPTARDDMFDAVEDSLLASNVFNVLVNDDTLPDTGETLTITGATMPLSGGSTMVVGNQIQYAPGADFFGLDTFEYTISDGNGGTDTATVRVNVSNTNDDPDAVDDDLGVSVDSMNNVLNVLSNDTFLPDPPETLTVTNVGTPDQGGTAQPSFDGSSIIYTPMQGFIGTETFSYTISDGNGGSDTALVTVDVSDEVLVIFRLEPTDTSGTPIETITVGEEFSLRVWAEHTMATNDPTGGVFSGYLDVLYASQFVSVNGAIDHGSTYGNGLSGDTSLPGLIDEAGGFDGFTPLGTGEFLLFEVPMIADAEGQFTFTSNQADQSNHLVLVFGSNDPISANLVDYGTFDFEVSAAFSAFTNLENPVDVDADGEVTPLDALLIINEINRGTVELEPASATAAAGSGAVNLMMTSPGATSTRYIDVNADGILSPLDALMVINVINADTGASQAAGTASASASQLLETITSDITESDNFDTAKGRANAAGAALAALPVPATHAAVMASRLDSTVSIDASPNILGENGEATKEQVQSLFVAALDDPIRRIDLTSQYSTNLRLREKALTEESLDGAMDSVLNEIADEIALAWTE